MARPGKSKIKGINLEIYIDDDMVKAILTALESKKSVIELQHVYFRQLQVEDLSHEGLKIENLKIPVGRITKVKLKLTSSDA